MVIKDKLGPLQNSEIVCGTQFSSFTWYLPSSLCPDAKGVLAESLNPQKLSRKQLTEGDAKSAPLVWTAEIAPSFGAFSVTLKNLVWSDHVYQTETWVRRNAKE